MSTINVDVVDPQSGDNVDVNGVEIRGYNQAIKLGAGAGDTLGNYSLAIGVLSLPLSTGQSNTSVGFGACSSQTTGFGNTALGSLTLQSLTTTSNNTAVGYHALIHSDPNGTGANTAIGSQALEALTTGNKNIGLGLNSGSNLTTGDNNISIGCDTTGSSATVSDEITLGNSLHTVLRCAVTSITSLSDARDKKNIEELPVGLEFIKNLKPVSFVWNERAENGKHDIKDFGFIAQDLKKSQEDINLADTLKLVYEENPEKLEASYGKLIPILVKAIQDLTAKVELLEKK
jgi:hypothetical protein